MPTARVSVTKMHGARNDFVILDSRAQRIDDLPSFARWICDRHVGIGADGVIAIEAAAHADARMRVFNTDGSEAEMCGNGVRCAALWLEQAGAGERLRIETAAGIIETQIVAREPEALVRIGMGQPRIAVNPVPFLDDARFVDLGNPHIVLFRKHSDDIDLTMLATRLQSAPFFPKGTNVHIAAVEGENRLRVRHWERGVGLTMACGTGAVACVVAAMDKGVVTSPVDVFVPGGHLIVEWDGSHDAYLTGPAVRVFDTEVAW